MPSVTSAPAIDLVTSPLSNRVAVALVGPQIVLAVLSIVLIGLGWFNRNPFWSATMLTLSEAAALHDQAAAVVLLESGADPHRPYSVRAGLTADRALELTPVQAAIREDRPEMVELLLSHGLAVNAGQICEWLRLATADGKHDVIDYLQARFPTESGACSPQAEGEGR
jgi:hypothetical protein